MSNNNSMLTSLNDIPIKTNNNTEELYDPDIKEIFKEYEKKENNNEINNNIQEIEKIIENSEIYNNNNDNDNDNNINVNNYNENNSNYEKIYNTEFEKEMENLMDSATLNIDNNNTSDNSDNNDLFTKKNITKIGIILVVFILVSNSNLIKLLNKYIPDNIYNVIILYDKYIYYVLTIIVLYILYYFKYL